MSNRNLTAPTRIGPTRFATWVSDLGFGAPSGTRTPNPLKAAAPTLAVWAVLLIWALTWANAVPGVVWCWVALAHVCRDGRGVKRGSQDPTVCGFAVTEGRCQLPKWRALSRARLASCRACAATRRYSAARWGRCKTKSSYTRATSSSTLAISKASSTRRECNAAVRESSGWWTRWTDRGDEASSSAGGSRSSATCPSSGIGRSPRLAACSSLSGSTSPTCPPNRVLTRIPTSWTRQPIAQFAEGLRGIAALSAPSARATEMRRDTLMAYRIGPAP